MQTAPSGTVLWSRTVSDGAARPLQMLASAVCPLRSARVVFETTRFPRRSVRQELCSSSSGIGTRVAYETLGCCARRGASSFFSNASSRSACCPFGSAHLLLARAERIARARPSAAQKQPNLRTGCRLCETRTRVSPRLRVPAAEAPNAWSGRSFREWSTAPRDNIRAVRLGYRFPETPKKIHFS